MNFYAALKFVLRWEGGYHHDKDDSGGATNKGVTQRVYDAWRRGRRMPTRSVKHLDVWEYRQLYRVRYWNKAKCDRLPPKLAFVHFGSAVNHGPRQAVRFLQRSVGAKADGFYGPQTQKLVDAVVRQQAVLFCVNNYCGYRREFYINLARRRPKDKKYLRGWLNRLNSLRKEVGLHRVS